MNPHRQFQPPLRCQTEPDASMPAEQVVRRNKMPSARLGWREAETIPAPWFLQGKVVLMELGSGSSAAPGSSHVAGYRGGGNGAQHPAAWAAVPPPADGAVGMAAPFFWLNWAVHEIIC